MNPLFPRHMHGDDGAAICFSRKLHSLATCCNWAYTLCVFGHRHMFWSAAPVGRGICPIFVKICLGPVASKHPCMGAAQAVRCACDFRVMRFGSIVF